MRYIIYGAGAIGGVVGVGLVRSGQEVVLIARGEHYRAIRDHGLSITDPNGTAVYELPIVEHPRAIDFRSDDAVILSIKGQDTLEALNSLVRFAPPSIAVFCMQNGVNNEPVTLRFFENVYGVCVAGSTASIEPGAIVAESGPVHGCLEIGRYPYGLDDRVFALRDALSESWVAVAQERVMEWKYTKMLRNLVLVIQALCGVKKRHGRLYDLVRAEGEACLRAAGIVFVDDETWRIARSKGPTVPRTLMEDGIGGSSWQSLERQTGSIETAYLNGEIVFLSRMYGVQAPANALLYRLAMKAVAEGRPPGTMKEEELLALLDR